MVPFNLKVLATFGLCSNCSQKLDECSLARIFVNPLPCSVSMICILKEKNDTGKNVSCMGTWENWGNMGGP